uniref:Pco062200b n=1 Tax=Arundo donax TaxID=35708 RepID=A0A0A9FLH0_ARUDO
MGPASARRLWALGFVLAAARPWAERGTAMAAPKERIGGWDWDGKRLAMGAWVLVE